MTKTALMKTKSVHLWVFLSSILLILSFPGPDLGVLSLLALVPLLHGLAGMGRTRAFFAGWGIGIGWFFVSYNWVTNSLIAFGAIPPALAQALILLLSMIHGVYIGVFSLFVPPALSRETLTGGVRKGEGTGRAGKPHRSAAWHPALAVLFLPSLWVVLEYLRCVFPAPFPWLILGTSLWKVDYTGQLYPFVGAYGVSFWIVCVNVLALMVLRSDPSRRKRVVTALVAVLVVPVLLIPFQSTGKGPIIRAGIVQGNVEQDEKWDAAILGETVSRYLKMSEEAVREGAELLVWPETAVPTYYQAEPGLIKRLRGFVAQHGIHLVFGSPGYEINGQEVLLYNRVYHLTPEGAESSYDKAELVPFGEYVPLGKLFPFVDRMVPGEGEFARGKWSGPFRTQVPSGALVCFEIAFPWMARREVADGSRLLINVTNDAWFGTTWGPYQHLALATVRARENGVPVLRAANTGISAIIDRRGRILQSLPLDRRGVVVGDVETGATLTFYTRFGDWIVILSAAVISVYLLTFFRLWRLRKWKT